MLITLFRVKDEKELPLNIHHWQSEKLSFSVDGKTWSSSLELITGTEKTGKEKKKRKGEKKRS